ncbi:DUF3068 domain-containing protein [Sphaerisporangium sp. TRM90804]|uniref:DUF3068 domain-containing protein n=1 Tax=Sphaerisporangium sp. TRM90804 TaxID=3031113 RepID=UPI0024491213|nr:DUF3068 domain-containing protein [Sphaerisporangium sp. TRM90804]MDH2427906.1 DUF3068 domain-containing protein [Sphaerisporangium sp. TRM90804]
MRRGAGLALVVLGAFLLTGAALVRFYVAERVPAARLDHYAVVATEAAGATYFDPATVSVRTGTVRGTTTIRGDAGQGGDGFAVWDSFTALVAADGAPVLYFEERAAHDRRTGEAVSCCGEFAGDRGPAAHRGQVFAWPHGTQKRTYQVWDGLTERAYPARFDGADTVDGLAVYRFVSAVPPTPGQTRALPPKLLGAEGEDDVPVTLWTGAARTYWVEPLTGTVVNAVRAVDQEYRAADGEKRLTVFRGTLRHTAEQVAGDAATARRGGAQVRALTVTVPLGALALGAIALAAGALVLRRASRLPAGGRGPAHAVLSGDAAPAAGSR